MNDFNPIERLKSLNIMEVFTKPTQSKEDITTQNKLSSLEKVKNELNTKPETTSTLAKDYIKQLMTPVLSANNPSINKAYAVVSVILAPLTLTGGAIGLGIAKLLNKAGLNVKEETFMNKGLLIGSFGTLAILFILIGSLGTSISSNKVKQTQNQNALMAKIGNFKEEVRNGNKFKDPSTGEPFRDPKKISEAIKEITKEYIKLRQEIAATGKQYKFSNASFRRQANTELGVLKVLIKEGIGITEKHLNANAEQIENELGEAKEAVTPSIPKAVLPENQKVFLTPSEEIRTEEFITQRALKELENVEKSDISHLDFDIGAIKKEFDELEMALLSENLSDLSDLTEYNEEAAKILKDLELSEASERSEPVNLEELGFTEEEKNLFNVLKGLVGGPEVMSESPKVVEKKEEIRESQIQPSSDEDIV